MGRSKNKKRGAMGKGPAPFSEIGRRARDLLTKDYNYDQKFSLSIPNPHGMGFTANGVQKGQIFVGDIRSVYRNRKTTVDVKVDTYSSVSTKVTYDVGPGTKAAISFSVPDHKSGKKYGDLQVSTRVTCVVVPRTKAAISFSFPNHKSDKLDVDYLHHHAAIHSSIGLNPSPRLEVSAAIGLKDVAIGGEIGFDTSSSSFTKYNAGISYNKPDFSAALILTDKGQTVKASYAHLVNPSTGTEVAAEMTHRLSSLKNSFSIGSAHKVDSKTLVKTRFSDNGKIAVLSQREWRPKSLVTFSAEYDTKAVDTAPKFGLDIALRP
ncbi:hypothetical protein ACS0TY_031145 [Phlomoides rotata]